MQVPSIAAVQLTAQSVPAGPFILQAKRAKSRKGRRTLGEEWMEHLIDRMEKEYTAELQVRTAGVVRAAEWCRLLRHGPDQLDAWVTTPVLLPALESHPFSTLPCCSGIPASG